ncbi:hypothetical protein GCM10018781_37020 [Kitasatospora indigofera]|uniref:Uncharacterized protein n=1 Tax=Kitasatospora indigofera TaxID=67307 RepID=A0A919KU40_9ACTN|nr:hypothetical protein GCM10018781_37020 [Kitasatospora indigofera]
MHSEAANSAYARVSYRGVRTLARLLTRLMSRTCQHRTVCPWSQRTPAARTRPPRSPAGATYPAGANTASSRPATGPARPGPHRPAPARTATATVRPIHP